jgi:hypothetical protein
MPAKAGIPKYQMRWLEKYWTPAFTGVTTIYEVVIFDVLVRSRKSTPNVMPAKAGIQKYQMRWLEKHWTPAFAGVTTIYEVVIFGEGDGRGKSGAVPNFPNSPGYRRSPV